jgi:hypothetical protein
MAESSNTCSRRLPGWLSATALLTAGYLCGSANIGFRTVDAEPRATAPRQAFLSGSERSEVVLQEMKTILERIDGRLERFEKSQGGSRPPMGAVR